MEKVISKDGTPLAYQSTGSGRPLILVHGTGAAHTRWTPVVPALAQRFRVCAVDRRGRGESGDPGPYDMRREFEDVAALADAFGEPVDLLGHSYGGVCSLEAALLTGNIRKLILYEPPLPVEGVPIFPDGVIARLQALLNQGDRAGVVSGFMREVVRMPAYEFERFRASPAWPGRVAAAHTLPRELRALESYRFRPERFAAMKLPTLLLVGGDSPHFLKAAIGSAHAALPHSRLVSLPGQQHIAMDTAPELFVREVTAFLDAAD
jgi:pimeloyl-ACP methyl ester carboxylesterase